MDDDGEDGLAVEENYYAFLNVPRNATPEQINTAYRNLSRIFHPDKHVNDDKKQEAELIFNRTKRAYEVLSDPHKRVIYDCLGTKGLETEGWEIVQKTRTPQEIREEYERLGKEREERRLQQKTNPRGNIVVNINATEMFTTYDDEEYNQFSLGSIEISGMSISQSIEAPMTNRDTVVLSGNLSSHNGVGNGNFILAGRRLVNKGWFEFDIGAGNGPTLALKGSKTLTQRVFFNGGVNINFRNDYVLPGLVGTLAVQLNKNTIGYLTYNAGIQSSLSTIVERTTEKHHMLLNATIGIPHCFLFSSYTRKLDEYKLKIRLATKVGTFGYSIEYGMDKKVSKYSTIGATVVFGAPSGVTLKLKYVRSSQSFIFPIHLSEDVIPSAIFYATVTPIISWLLIKQLILDPMNAEKKRREIEKTKEINRNRMDMKQREAEAAIDLMAAVYNRICREETERNGLIIVNALYGNTEGLSESDDMSQNRSHPAVIDVTIPLQCLVKEGRLILYDANKSELSGFYDPCIGEDKYLKIEYTHRNIKSVIQIADKEPLKLPLEEVVS